MARKPVPCWLWLQQRGLDFSSENFDRWWREESKYVYGAIPIARVRRGKRVVIPPEWRGKVADRQTIRKRQSKQTRKARLNRTWSPRCSKGIRWRQEAQAPKLEDWGNDLLLVKRAE